MIKQFRPMEKILLLCIAVSALINLLYLAGFVTSSVCTACFVVVMVFNIIFMITGFQSKAQMEQNKKASAEERAVLEKQQKFRNTVSAIWAATYIMTLFTNV